MKRIYGLPHSLDSRTRVLILGSFPGIQSLQAQQYYAHPQNLFWRIVGESIGEDLIKQPYDDRLRTLLQHRIGVWDVYESCLREGSMDKDIREPCTNDFAALRTTSPHLQRICFNGQKAASHAPHFENYDVVILPSTSPANASVPYAKKLQAWKRALTVD